MSDCSDWSKWSCWPEWSCWSERSYWPDWSCGSDWVVLLRCPGRSVSAIRCSVFLPGTWSPRSLIGLSDAMVFLFCATILCSDSILRVNNASNNAKCVLFCDDLAFWHSVARKQTKTIPFWYYLLLSGVVILMCTMLDGRACKLMM